MHIYGKREFCLYLKIEKKRYYIIDQQIVQHFVRSVNVFQTPLSLYANQIINLFLNSRISVNHYKRVEILANREIFLPLNVPLV